MLQATPINIEKDQYQKISFDFLKRFFLKLWLFLFPLFFLTFTSSFFNFNKLALTVVIVLVLILLSTLELLFNKKLNWKSTSLESYFVLLILASSLSVIISSPNKIQALLYSNYSPLLILFLSILTYYLIKLEINPKPYILSSGILLSILTVVFFFNPFQKIPLPSNLEFLKTPYFTPIGSYLDLLVFLGFLTGWGLVNFFVQKKKKRVVDYLLFLPILVGFLVAGYNLLKPQTVNNQPFQILLPPLRLSWYAAVEILKNPLTAIFGVGADNYATIFTRVKDVAYNQSELWQINFFNFARNFAFHIFTVGGILGFFSSALFYLKLLKHSETIGDLEAFSLTLLFLPVAFLAPPSLIVWFLFFSLIIISSRKLQKQEVILDLSKVIPVYATLSILSFLFIASISYLFGRAYAAEVYFKKALDALQNNQAQETYNFHRKAIQYNPYVERFRISFSQLNLLLVNNFTQQILDEQAKEKPDQERINNLRQNALQATQSAINEAKAAVTLNPQKAANWANLAEIYRNIINLAQNADIWTISAYQRAIQIDPQNPTYRLNLGGVHYSLGQYKQALSFFEQAVALKPDWANAHYNLAWSAYNLQDYQRAVSEMQNVLDLLDPKKAKADYEKAKKELEEFKKKLEETQKATPSAEISPTPTPNQLSLPTPVPTLQKKLTLPKEASPEAR